MGTSWAGLCLDTCCLWSTFHYESVWRAKGQLQAAPGRVRRHTASPPLLLPRQQAASRATAPSPLHLWKFTLLVLLVFPHRLLLLPPLLVLQALMPTSGSCSFCIEGEPKITGGQHEAGAGERRPRPRAGDQQNRSAE